MKTVRALTIASIAVSFLTSLHVSNACSINGKEGILPENNLKIGIGALNTSGINEAIFNQIIDRVEKVYQPIVASAGGTLKINRLWTDSTVNAYATRSGKTWTVSMFGGLARHPEMTQDGLALVVCHELGHHLGGAPKAGIFFNRWASNEGQADYFGVLKCMRNVFAHDSNFPHDSVPAIVSDHCRKSFDRASEVSVCERSSMAGMSLGRLFASLRLNLNDLAAPQFETPDPSRVSRTFNGHPAAQCRLDTYFQGAICDKPVTEDVSSTDPTAGTCSMEKGDAFGFRPLCWYKPSASRN